MAWKDGKIATCIVKVQPSLIQVKSSCVAGDLGKIVCDEYGDEDCCVDENQQGRRWYCVEGKKDP
jgi:hypothetical protein